VDGALKTCATSKRSFVSIRIWLSHRNHTSLTSMKIANEKNAPTFCFNKLSFQVFLLHFPSPLPLFRHDELANERKNDDDDDYSRNDGTTQEREKTNFSIKCQE